MVEKICIVGAGSWGTAQAVLLSQKAAGVYLWGRPEDGMDLIARDRENKQFLPQVPLASNIYPTTDLKTALTGSSYLILAVPAQTVRIVVRSLLPYYMRGTVIVNTAKGMELSTGKSMSQVIADVCGDDIKTDLVCLSGPSHAEEVSRKIPTAVTIAAYCQETAIKVQQLYMTPEFRVYTNPDMTGVELGGAVKNIVAMAAGISDGLGYGDNSRAALITRGLHEITRLGKALGGNPHTFSGLSGLGDLVATCGSRFSRNRKFGELIGKGMPIFSALEEVGMVVEGYYTCPVTYRIAEALEVEMPIVRACYRIVEEHRSPQEEINALMVRDMKAESETW